MNLREAARAVSGAMGIMGGTPFPMVNEAVDELRAALAAPDPLETAARALLRAWDESTVEDGFPWIELDALREALGDS